MDRRSFLVAGAAGLISAGAARAELAPSLDAPLSISGVGLVCRDADGVSDWYERLLGMRRLEDTPYAILLGTGDLPLLELIRAPESTLPLRREAGLYHTAFLLRDRLALARWIRHLAESGLPVDGAADHLVSEAIYLTDPEGNGVEVYADRAPESWIWDGDQVRMATDPLDLDGIMAGLQPSSPVWGRDETFGIGHVHLRVGDAASAIEWWHDTIGLDLVRGRADAGFLSSGRYHHHIAVNAWESAGAGPRLAGRTGLAWVGLKDRLDVDARTMADPWGNEVRLNRPWRT